MSAVEIEHPEIMSVIQNAIGFYYVYATEPERVETVGENRMVRYEEEEMTMINTVATAVYLHLLEGEYLNVGSE